MKNDDLLIEIDGAEVPELYEDLIGLEVELDDQLTGMFRMKIGLLLDTDGDWTYLDDPRFSLWRKVVITAGVEDDSPQLISGYITHLRPEFGVGLEQCVLEVWGMDTGVLLDRADQLRAWPNKRDSDIATELFRTYGLTPQVTDTAVVHDEELSTIIQRETDMQLLRRLARRNGYECWIDGDNGYFGPSGLTGDPQPVLAVQFGEDTTVSTFRLEANALTPAAVAAYQHDHLSGDLIEVTTEASSESPLGAQPAATVTAGPGDGARVVVAQTATTGAAEMAALTQGLYDDGSWFVTGEGDVIANEYGAVLKPRAVVTVKGVGATHSGFYYVTHVTHRFTPDGYQQHFKVKRNALTALGTEPFVADDGNPLAGLL